MEEEIILTNVEAIINVLKEQSKTVVEFNKANGITIECKINPIKTRKQMERELNTLCKKLNLLPIEITEKDDSETLYYLQFPDLDVQYPEEIIIKMYNDNFKWLLDNIRNFPDDKELTMDYCLNNQKTFIRTAIQTYCRSNINPYRDNVRKYIEDIEYIKKVTQIYLKFLDWYFLDITQQGE